MTGTRPPGLRGLVTGSRGAVDAPGFRPVAVVVADLEDDGAWDPPQARGEFGSAWVLARLHGRPLGELTVARPPGEPAPDALPRAVGHALRERWGPLVTHHLAEHAGRRGGPGVPVAGWDACLGGPARAPASASVSVIVPTCRRPQSVVACVDSIVAARGTLDVEVLVVDNAPDGRTRAALAARHPDSAGVRYLAEPRPGASRARNRGVAAAQGDVLAFVDDDVVVDRSWLAALLDALHTRPDVDCVTGLVIPEALGTPVQLWFEQFGGFNRGYQRRAYDLSEHPGDTLLYPYTAGALGGLGNAAFRRSALDRAAAFEVTLGPGTPAYGAEDQDAFVSLLRRGGRLLYEPSALVRHRHRDSYADLRWQVFTYGAGMVAGLLHWGMADRAVGRELIRRTAAALPGVVRGGNRAVALPSATHDCPRELRRLERLGHLYGPVAYARAVVHRRRLDAAAPATGPRP